MLLVASPAYPQPPIDGDKIRWSGLLRELTELAQVHAVFGYLPEPPTREARSELFDRHFAGIDMVPTPKLEVMLRAGALALAGRSTAFGRRATPAWRRAVATAAWEHQPSSILLLGTSGGYVPPLPAPTWLDLVDVRSRLRTLAGDQLTSRRVLDAEIALARRHRIILTSPSDRDWLLAHGVEPSRATVVPNGVDPGLFEVTPAVDSDRLLFVGNLNTGNSLTGLQWFLRECWPSIRSSHSTARLRIVGYGADRISAADRVEIFANVPDVRPHYAAAALAIAPMIAARGVQNKALEAMAAGLPLVCTSPVVRGFLAGQPAWEVADSARAMVDACLTLLRDRDRAARLGALGRSFVRERYDWGRSARLLYDLLL